MENLDKLVEHIQNRVNEYFKRFPILTPEKVSYTNGRRYIRIVLTGDTGQKSVWGFVDKQTGNILYPHGWKAPVTKNPRGNINNSETWHAFTNHSPGYLK